jgi:hypothetical protein
VSRDEAVANLTFNRGDEVQTANGLREKLSFVVEGQSSVWKLSGVHPRFGPNWQLLTQGSEEEKQVVVGSVGDVFKIHLSDFEYTFVTIAEGAILKEINYIVFEDFVYSISRRWYNIVKNTGLFQGNLDESD